MTEHLIALGHRRIAFLAGRPDLESARRREAGYRAALEAAGIAFDPDLVRVGGFKEETAEAPAHELLTRSPRPTAVFAANDLSAIQTMRTAAELGLRVPDDVSVVGFDNIPDSALTDAAADHRRPVDPGPGRRRRAHPAGADRRPRAQRPAAIRSTSRCPRSS